MRTSIDGRASAFVAAAIERAKENIEERIRRDERASLKRRVLEIIEDDIATVRAIGGPGSKAAAATLEHARERIEREIEPAPASPNETAQEKR